MITLTIKDEDCEILNNVNIEIPDDMTAEDLGNEIQEVIEDFFDIIEEL